MRKRRSSVVDIPIEKRRRSTRLHDYKRPWFDLPVELVECIMGKLLFTDQVCFRSVCKRWRSVRRVKPAKQIPWLLIWHNKSFASCKLYDPVYKKTLTIHNTCLKDFPYSGAVIWSSIKGWLLISFHDNSSFILYSPFTNEIIQFPPFDHCIKDFYTSAAMFSSPPSSPDCIIFIKLHGRNSTQSIFIKTCRPGDSSWTSKNFNINQLFLDSNVGVYNDGFFYCINNNIRILGTYNVALQTWTVLDIPSTLPGNVFVYHRRLVEYGGELLSVPYGDNPETILRLPRTQESWVQFDSLGDRVIFISNTIGLVSDSAPKSGIKNGVYSFSDGKPKYYSFKSRKTHYDRRIYKAITTEDSVMIPICDKNFCNMTWIEPIVQEIEDQSSRSV
ncbi:hypothetical protein GIB67_019563 [Kingdonia uniflora]|uniref:F-box domain-containing protein n=1 Tax=Kingdonia uniflora TaxID=39325 RepID=A0A7J7N0F9_9MAGN|nr:hypothetical protein GIB67_019563 [Kingdonia uniflora]